MAKLSVVTMPEHRSELQIELLNQRLADSIFAKDLEAIADCYLPGKTMFTLAPPLQFTPKNSRGARGLREWLDSWDGPLEIETTDLHIFSEGSLAFAYCLKRMTGTQKGQKVDLWFRETLGFQKRDGVWKIAHQHESVPFYMDGSFKAAVDLLPESPE